MLLGNGLADRAAKWGSGQELWEKEEMGKREKVSEDGKERESLKSCRSSSEPGCTVEPSKSCPQWGHSQGSKHCVSFKSHAFNVSIFKLNGAVFDLKMIVQD